MSFIGGCDFQINAADHLGVASGDLLRSTIVCGPFWGSLAVWESFVVLYRLSWLQ